MSRSIQFLGSLTAVLLLLLGLPSATQAQAPSTTARVTQVDTSRYPDVTLYVAVLDATNKPRSGLKQSDFGVIEDGKDVKITDFVGGGHVQINTALAIDRSGSMESDNKLDSAKEAAQTFTAQMQANDQTTIIPFESILDLNFPFSSDKGRITAAIDNISTDNSTGTAIYDAVVAGVNKLKDIEGRRFLVVLTDGQDNRSRNNAEKAITYANKYNQPVYTVGFGRQNAPGDDWINERVLRQVADQTGGEYFYAPDRSELVALYDRLAGSLHAEYRLTYRSPRPNYDGTKRDLRVSVEGLTSAGSYVEEHLINVHSSTPVGLALLLPLLALLVFPTLLRFWGRKLPKGPQTLVAQETKLVPQVQPLPPKAASPLQPASPNVTDTVCTKCGKALRTGARFCNGCGAKQTL